MCSLGLFLLPCDNEWPLLGDRHLLERNSLFFCTSEIANKQKPRHSLKITNRVENTYLPVVTFEATV